MEYKKWTTKCWPMKLRAQIHKIISQFSIKSKLFIGAGLSAIWLMVFVINIILTQSQSKGTIHDILEQQQPALTAALELKGKLKDATTAMAYYLISGDNQYKVVYLKTIQERKEPLEFLGSHNLIVSNEHANALVADIIEDFDKLIETETEVFPIAEDHYKNLPALGYATEEIFPFFIKAFDIFTIMLNDEADERASRRRKQLLIELNNTHKYWLNMTRGIRSYIAYKNTASRDEITTNYMLYLNILNKLEKLKPLMTFGQEDAFDRLKL